MEKLFKLSQVLENIMDFSIKCWLYLPEDEEWNLNSRAAILESDEVPPELEDEPNAGTPKYAIENKLMKALPISEVQDIKINLRSQSAEFDLEELLNAFLYYYDNDAFISL